jgi:hypothetical protein
MCDVSSLWLWLSFCLVQHFRSSQQPYHFLMREAVKNKSKSSSPLPFGRSKWATGWQYKPQEKRDWK